MRSTGRFLGSLTATLALAVLLAAPLGALETSAPFVPASGPTLRPAPPIVMQELEPYRADGTGTISGHLTTRTKLNNDVEEFFHTRVWSVPDVPYGRWLVERYHSDYFDRSNVAIDDGVYPFIRESDTDQKGDYTIDHLPNGKYVVFTEMYLATASGAHASTEQRAALDAEGNPATADVPVLAYEHVKSETIFLSGHTTIGQGNDPFDFHVDEDLVSETDHPALGVLPVQPAPPLTAQQLRPYANSGTSSITGRLMVRLQGATRTNYYGGYTVKLWPAVPYAAWVLDAQRRSWLSRDDTVGDIPISQFANRRFFQAMRRTVTDKNGYFTFSNLPALPYVVHMEIDVAREHYLHDAPDSTTTLYDENGNPSATFHHTDHSRDYKCDRTGLLASVTRPKPGETVTVPMALLVSHLEDGAGDCFMFHKD